MNNQVYPSNNQELPFDNEKLAFDNQKIYSGRIPIKQTSLCDICCYGFILLGFICCPPCLYKRGY